MNEESQEATTWKTCPCCGQGVIPFKLGVCFCGTQVGRIQYVQNANNFAKNWYTYVDNDMSGYDTAIKETFAGIEEFGFSD